MVGALQAAVFKLESVPEKVVGLLAIKRNTLELVNPAGGIVDEGSSDLALAGMGAIPLAPNAKRRGTEVRLVSVLDRKDVVIKCSKNTFFK